MAVVAGAASAVLQILLWARDALRRSDYLLGGGVAVSILAIVGAVGLFISRGQPDAKRLAIVALDDSRQLMPPETARALTSYLETLITSVLERRRQAERFRDIVVQQLERVFTVVKSDVTTEERYD